MEITSRYFAILSIATIFVYYLINNKYRMLFLTLISCFFIATWSFNLLIYILAFTAINFVIGRQISVSGHKKAIFRTGIVINLIQIILLKYVDLTLVPTFRIFNYNLNLGRISELLVPVGISYFTLQGIGYLINVYYGWEKPEKKYHDLLLYIAFFPKFLSGPIERSNHFLPQLKGLHEFNENNLSEGLKIALFGLFKKIAIANQLAILITRAYSNLDSAGGSLLWIVMFIQPLYLYFDFSGYTDIAIGISKSFGIDILPNFERPFFSENMTTFWRRFHRSLSSWFNDYIFKQVSYKHKKWGIYASAYGVLITFILFGIWHGAGWNFMVLGLLQALALNYEFFTKKIRIKFFAIFPQNIKVWLGRVFTYSFYAWSLVFFFSPDLKTSFTFFSKLTGTSNSLMVEPDIGAVFRIFMVTVFIAIILGLELFRNDFRESYSKFECYWKGNNNGNRIFRWTVYYLIITIIILAGNIENQFIYSQF
jgi:D-alanyl-lipoteichoic acid acyltransferase DltB (MBOAT superfamily)